MPEPAGETKIPVIVGIISAQHTPSVSGDESVAISAMTAGETAYDADYMLGFVVPGNTVTVTASGTIPDVATTITAVDENGVVLEYTTVSRSSKDITVPEGTAAVYVGAYAFPE